MEIEIRTIIEEELAKLGCPQLFRTPIVAFSSAEDPRYMELKTIIGQWHKTPKELLPEAQSVISYFVPFTKEVTAAPRNSENGSPLWSEAYQIINGYFDVINDAVRRYLEEQGYAAVTIQSTHNYDPKELKAFWSHRSAAVIAGLATLGANRLAITEKGSSGRFCTVITSAKLEEKKDPAGPQCLYFRDGSCGLCFRACPTGALKPDCMDKFACQEELNKNQQWLRMHTELTSADTCGKCISVCPLAYVE